MESTETDKLNGFEEIPLRAPPPRSSVGLNKKAIIISLTSVGLLIGFVMLESLRPVNDGDKAAAPTTSHYNPNDKIRELPDDYSQIRKKKVEVKAEEPKGMLSPVSVPIAESPEDKIANEFRLKMLRRKYEARESSPEFDTVKLNQFSSSKRGEGSSLSSGNNGGVSVSVGLESQPGSLNARDEANRQDEKGAFLNQDRSSEYFLREELVPLISKYAVQAGTVIPGVLLTGINSDLPGQLSGQISQNVYDSKDGRYLLLPQGAKVIGEYDSKIVYGQERVLIVWTRVILPNGKSINLEGMPGVDLSGYAGLTDKVNNHYGKILTGVVFGSVLGAGAQMANGYNRYGNPSFEELALSGAAQNINEAGQQITRKNLNIQPTLEIRPGFRFNIFVTKDISLEPYNNE